ncbi:glycosyltransferase family 2 protein [Asaia siamensis]
MSKIAAVLFVKNEIDDIAFWLAWHFHVGFDTIIVYDDHSSDGTWEILTETAKILDVRCHRAVDADQFNIRQQRTYLDALDRHRDEFDWLLFLDSDEYLDIRDGSSVQNLLARYPEANGLALNWCCYGSSNHVIKPPSPNVFENYTQRSEPDFEYNYTVKSFVRPKKTETRYLNPHRFAVDGAYVTTDHQPVTWKDEHPERTRTLAQWDVARINHYVIRSVHHYLEKMKRRVDIRESGMGLSLFRHCDRNDHHDSIAADRYDGMMPLLNRIQAQINRKIFRKMVATCGRGLNGEIDEIYRAQSRDFSASTLKTTHGTIVGYDRETGRLCHRHDIESDDRTVPVVALTCPAWPNSLFLTTQEGTTPLYAAGDPRVSAILAFRIVGSDGHSFALQNPVTGLNASFLPTTEAEINVEVNRSRINAWEMLQAFPLASVPAGAVEEAIGTICNIMDPSETALSDADAIVPDAFIAGVQLLPETVQHHWKSRNHIPHFPWLEYGICLSV